MVPDWLDAATLEWVILAVIGGLMIGLVMVTRFIHKVITRLLFYLVLVGLAGALWVQRGELQDCAQTCECTLFGQEVEIPESRSPARCN